MINKKLKRVVSIATVAYFLLLFLIVPAHATDPSTWATGYAYCQKLTVNAAAGAGTNYTVCITVVNASGTSSGYVMYAPNSFYFSDFRDIYFADTSANAYSFWQENVTTGVNASYWVRIPLDLSSSSQSLYVYYGNYLATSRSNGINTFLLFDDFNGPSINTTLWTYTAGSGAYIEAPSGQLHLALSIPAPGSQATITSKTTFTSGIEFRQNFYMLNVYKWYFGPTVGNQAILYYGYTSPTPIVCGQLDHGTWNPLVPSGGWNVNTWYTFTVDWKPSAWTVFKVNDNKYTYNTTSYVPSTANVGDYVQQGTSGGDVYSDWAFVRPMVNPEPASGGWSTLTNPSPTPTPSPSPTPTPSPSPFPTFSANPVIVNNDRRALLTTFLTSGDFIGFIFACYTTLPNGETLLFAGGPLAIMAFFLLATRNWFFCGAVAFVVGGIATGISPIIGIQSSLIGNSLIFAGLVSVVLGIMGMRR